VYQFKKMVYVNIYISKRVVNNGTTRVNLVKIKPPAAIDPHRPALIDVSVLVSVDEAASCLFGAVNNTSNLRNMKEISKKVLVWLYPVTRQKRWLPRSELDWLLRDRRPQSRRSLLKLLVDRRLVASEKYSGRHWLRLTQPGRELVNGLFWAQLEQPPISAGWQVVVFRSAPAGDPGFRRLRRRLRAVKAGQVTPGVYLVAGKLPPGLRRALIEDYPASVMVVATDSWSFGDQLSVIEDIFTLSDIKVAYSGVSTELSQLLAESEGGKWLTDRQKRQIYLVFDRFWEVFCDDSGLLARLSPQVPRGRDCLITFNQLTTYMDI